jgi:hypothetical protein
MVLWVGRHGPWRTLGAVVAAWAMMAHAQDIETTLEDAIFPLELYESGKPKVLLAAQRLKRRSNEEVEGSGVRIEFRDEAGETKGVVLAQDCWCNRRAGLARSKGKVRFKRGGIVITGRGMTWNSKQQRIKILKDVRVVLNRIVIGDAWKPPAVMGGAQDGGDRRER